VQRAVAERWKAATGVPIVEGYGLTETSPIAICNALNIKDWTGNIGVPIPNTEAAILDDAGNAMATGQVGEICIRGPQVMKGYWQRPEETANVMTEDGYLRTGDMGYIDHEGYVFIVDRKKDMILVSGFNVYPNEVEEAVAMHEGVSDVAAIGIHDDNSGEAVKIFVVRKDPNLTAEELIKHCRQHLTGYKVPKHVEFRADLPRTNVGKILRRALKEGG
jgi:long-chain acyl-CoA synthetase